MRLYIKQKVFSFGDKFTVKDEYGNDKYFVEGEVLSWGKKLHVFDTAGHEVAFIRQEVFTWMPRFHVYLGARQAATVRKEFSFLTPRYAVDGLDWEVTGSFWEHDYEITKNGLPIVTITKEWMTWGDSYELNIRNPADELIALAVVLTIDCVVEQQNDNN